MRMPSSSGKSISTRFAICSGLHAVAHLRSWRRGLFRPFHAAVCGPATGVASGQQTWPESRSCTYSRSRSFSTSLAVFGRRAISSAFHCATDARYSRVPPRVAALRRSSREIVDGARPTRRAICLTPAPWAVSKAISSRSSNDRWRPVTGASKNVGMPPRSRNQRLPAACDAPTAIAASSLVSPLAISRQNNRSTSRRSDGLPGDFIGALPVNSRIHPAGLPINTSTIKVLRPPVESAQFRSNKFVRTLKAHRLRGSMGRVGACGDNAAMESFFALLQNNVLDRQRWTTRAELPLAIVSWIETTYHRRRRQRRLGKLTPIEFETIQPVVLAA